jgi:hypothetical protein
VGAIQGPSTTPSGSATGASSDIPDEFLTGLAAAAQPHGWNPEFMLRVMMSESNLLPTAQHSVGGATGLIQWEPPYPGGNTQESLKALGFMGQLPLAVQWWSQFEQGKPYRSVGDFYGAIAAPGNRLKTTDGVIARQGDGVYSGISAADPNHTGVVTLDMLETFANRNLGTARYQDVLARLQNLGITSSSGIFPSSTLGTLVLLGLLGAGAYYAYANRKYLTSSIRKAIPT